jgi:glycosyltransferase involved in cell wall biosynthesis
MRHPPKRLRIALMGSRGIPAQYSGFETFYEQIARRLSQRGHEVTVYNRRGHHPTVQQECAGARIVTLPTLRTKHLETIVHSFLSMVHALWTRQDVLYLVIVGNSPLVWLAHLFGRRVILNVDGADFARDKWQGFAKRYLSWCERIAARHADVVIADARVIQQRYATLYGRETVWIPYGANLGHRQSQAGDADLLARYDLVADDYLLFVSRMTPENRADVLVRAYIDSGITRPLVLVGDAPYVDDFKASLQALVQEVKSPQRIVLTGYLVGEDYWRISRHCRTFILPAGIDGTRPVLLDQMGLGNCVVVRDTSANVEVIGSAGLSFSDTDPVRSLSQKLTWLETEEGCQEMLRLRDAARARVQEHYDWERITDQYEDLFETVCGDRHDQ